jgi:hypothetical protein
MTIDGALRSDHVTEFRDLDQRRIQSARQEVLARYLDGRPVISGRDGYYSLGNR